MMLLLQLTACGDPETIRVGFIGGLTGRSADLGIASRNAVQLAVDAVNAAGGINGRPIELLVRDDKGSAEVGAEAARSLIAENVAGIIGPNLSSVASGVVPVINEANIVTISPTVSSLVFAGKDDSFFRVNSTTSQFATAYAERLKERGVMRVAAATDGRNSVYSDSWLNEFRKSFAAVGGSISKSASFDSQVDGDYYRVIASLLWDDPEGFIFVANGVDTAQLSQQLHKLGLVMPMMAVEWAASDSMIRLGGIAVEGMEVLQTFDQNDERSRYVAFRDAYKQRFRNDPSFASIAAYDSATVLCAALQAKAPGVSLKDAMDRLGPVAGLQQDLVFDSFGDGSRTNVFVVVENGKFIRR